MYDFETMDYFFQRVDAQWREWGERGMLDLAELDRRKADYDDHAPRDPEPAPMESEFVTHPMPAHACDTYAHALGAAVPNLEFGVLLGWTLRRPDAAPVTGARLRVGTHLYGEPIIVRPGELTPALVTHTGARYALPTPMFQEVVLDGAPPDASVVAVGMRVWTGGDVLCSKLIIPGVLARLRGLVVPPGDALWPAPTSPHLPPLMRVPPERFELPPLTDVDPYGEPLGARC